MPYGDLTYSEKSHSNFQKMQGKGIWTVSRKEGNQKSRVKFIKSEVPNYVAIYQLE